jgi:hypothetical protein
LLLLLGYADDQTLLSSFVTLSSIDDLTDSWTDDGIGRFAIAAEKNDDLYLRPTGVGIPEVEDVLLLFNLLSKLDTVEHEEIVDILFKLTGTRRNRRDWVVMVAMIRYYGLKLQ